ncbi:hypothetical protein FQR65_LT11080 [Abscondita terminalis]|nr:hypothetical protein FQR65_LT11080 [Abscondita terminalis]
MSTEGETRKLADLRVVDLRNELEKRGLDKGGNKQVMEEEGLDPKVHQFLTDQSKRMSSSQGDGDITKNPDDHEEDTEKSEVCSQCFLYLKLTNSTNTANENSDSVVEDSMTKPNEADDNTAKDVASESDNLIQLTLEEGETLHDIEMDSEVNDKKTELSLKSEDKEDSKDQPNKEDVAKPVPDSSGKTEDPQTGEGKGARVESSTTKSSSARSKKSRSRNLWITNIAQTTRATELKQALSAHGKVIGAKVVINAKQPGACCYGYVTMDTVEDADNCITKLNNTDLNGHIIRIEKVCPDHMNSIKLNPKLLNPSNDKRERTKSKSKHRDCRTSEKTSRDEVKNKEEIKEEPQTEGEDGERQKQKSKSRSSARSKDRSRRSSQSSRKRDPQILTYAQIKEQQERQRYRKRMLQEENRRRREEDSRRREEDSRRREIDRQQKSEAARLEREREKLRFEREKIEREKAEIIRLERERQKFEREKLELEKLELQRDKVRLQAEDRRAVKRPGSYRREDYDERKRSSSDRRYEGSIPQMRFDPPGTTRDSRYNDQERDRSPQYIQVREERERRSMTDHKDGIRSSREHRYVDSSKESPRFERGSGGSGSNSWGYPSSGMSNKTFSAGISGGSLMSSKPWAKDVWRPADPQNSHRWNSGNMSRSSQLSTPTFQGNSNLKLEPSCPPPPAINTYSDNRFEYKSMNAIRKY